MSLTEAQRDVMIGHHRRRAAEIAAERDEWKARAEQAEAKLRAVEAVEQVLFGSGVTFGAGFASGFNHALELVAEAIRSVER